MHFSGSSKSDCLALVEAFKVSLSHPLEAEVATQATSVFSHPAYESGECSLLLVLEGPVVAASFPELMRK